jgi:hypothetical protein
MLRASVVAVAFLEAEYNGGNDLLRRKGKGKGKA